LNSLGADIEYLEKEGFPPLRVNGKTLSSGEVSVDTSISSQFVSALLLLAPFLNSGLSINKTGENVSGSYTAMTISLLKSAGISVSAEGDVIQVLRGKIDISALEPECDWSSASFWYTVVALSHHGTITLKGLTPPEDSVQGDSSAASIFRSLGVSTNVTDDGLIIRKSFNVPAITRIRLDMRSTPDLVLPVVTAIAGLGYGALISGIDHLRYKESDRIRALISELRALNAYIDYAEKMLVVHPSDIRYLRPVNTYNDHRMAMAFAPLALISRTLEVRNPGVVKKSYPEFWSMMEKLGFEMIRK
jgi:3-phosphoshikimate 1-carboxyvinyltransferase